MMNDGHEVSGKVIGVGRDSISVAYHSLAIKDISEIVFKPGSTLGVIAAIATTVGLATIALTIDKQQDGFLFGGIGLAAAGGIVLIPTYFLKKHFNSSEYELTAVMIGSF